MKQSDLKHWKWSCTNRQYEAGAAVMRGHNGCVYFYDNTDMSPAELTEAALIAEHYEKTGRFSPDAEEPTREQIVAWMRRTRAVLATSNQGAEYWLIADMSACAVQLPHDASCADIGGAIDAVALITQRKREDVVREMVAL